MRSPRNGSDDIVIGVLAAFASVLIGAAVVFMSEGPPSFMSDDPPSVDTGESSALSESAKQGEQEERSSPPSAPVSPVEGGSEQAAEDESGRAGAQPESPTSTAVATPIGALKGAEDFDPPPGDGEEHSQEAAFAVDGDPATTWSTERYSAGLAAVGKDGVGLAVDAGSAVKADELELETETPGWSGEIYAASRQPPDLAGWGEPVGSISEASKDEAAPLELSEPARYYLVWVTDLGNGDTVELSEIRLLG